MATEKLPQDLHRELQRLWNASWRSGGMCGKGWTRVLPWDNRTHVIIWKVMDGDCADVQVKEARKKPTEATRFRVHLNTQNGERKQFYRIFLKKTQKLTWQVILQVFRLSKPQLKAVQNLRKGKRNDRTLLEETESLRIWPHKADQDSEEEEDSSEANDKMRHEDKMLETWRSNSNTLKNHPRFFLERAISLSQSRFCSLNEKLVTTGKKCGTLDKTSSCQDGRLQSWDSSDSG